MDLPGKTLVLNRCIEGEEWTETLCKVIRMRVEFLKSCSSREVEAQMALWSNVINFLHLHNTTVPVSWQGCHNFPQPKHFNDAHQTAHRHVGLKGQRKKKI